MSAQCDVTEQFLRCTPIHAQKQGSDQLKVYACLAGRFRSCVDAWVYCSRLWLVCVGQVHPFGSRSQRWYPQERKSVSSGIHVQSNVTGGERESRWLRGEVTIVCSGLSKSVVLIAARTQMLSFARATAQFLESDVWVLVHR